MLKGIVRRAKLLTEFLLYEEVILTGITLFYDDALNNVRRHLIHKQNQRTHIVWNVRNTNIERGQSDFQNVSAF